MSTQVKWTAQLDHVREVSLVGSADLDVWRERLAAEGLIPLSQHGGRTAILIVSAAGRFKGIRFRELSISVSASLNGRWCDTESLFLIRAFNSNRFFAFCERVFFSTPYDHANVAVVDDIPTSISITRNGRTLFDASMQRTQKPTTCSAQEREEAFVTKILLPSRKYTISRQRKIFFARICGATHVYPFIAGEDMLTIRPQVAGDVFHALLESNYLPQDWIVRSNATHAKSKTYKQAEVDALQRDAFVEPAE